MSKFKAGDVVELNSGGPVMTILEVKKMDGLYVNGLIKITLIIKKNFWNRI